MAKLNEGFLDSITMPMSLARYAYSMHFDQKRIADSSIETLMKFVAIPWLKSNKKYIPLLRKLGNDDLEAGLTKVVTLMQKNFSERVHKNDLSDSEKEFLGESHIRESNNLQSVIDSFKDFAKSKGLEVKTNEYGQNRIETEYADFSFEIIDGEDCPPYILAETLDDYLDEDGYISYKCRGLKSLMSAFVKFCHTYCPEKLSESKKLHEADDDDDLLGYGEETDEPITDVYTGELTGRPIGKHRYHPSELDYAADSRELEGWDALDDPDAPAKDYPIAWRNEQAAAGPDLAEKDWEELMHQSCDTDTSNGMGGFYMNAYDYEEGNRDDGRDFYDVGLKESTLFESILKGRK